MPSLRDILSAPRPPHANIIYDYVSGPYLYYTQYRTLYKNNLPILKWSWQKNKFDAITQGYIPPYDLEFKEQVSTNATIKSALRFAATMSPSYGYDIVRTDQSLVYRSNYTQTYLITAGLMSKADLLRHVQADP